MMRVLALLAMLVASVGAEPVTRLPPVGSRLEFTLARAQDPYLCGDAVIRAALALRETGGGFNLPVNCPRLALRWPYSTRTVHGDTWVTDTLTDEIVLRIPRAPAAAPPVRSARQSERHEAGALIIDVGRTP